MRLKKKQDLRKISVFIIDKGKGTKEIVAEYGNLSESEKQNITEDGSLFIQREFVKGSRKDTYITESEYLQLVKDLTNRIVEESNTSSPQKEDASKKKVTPQPQTRICPFCSADLLASDMFCAYCGKKVQNIKFCGECGEVNNISDNFCCNCGSKF